MTEGSDLKLPKWPFYLGDILLVSLALGILFLQKGVLTPWSILWVVISVALGAILFILPFILEFKGKIRLSRQEAFENEVDEEQFMQLQRALSELIRVEGNIRQQIDKQTGILATHESLIKSLELQVHELNDLQVRLSENGDKLVKFKPEFEKIEAEEKEVFEESKGEEDDEIGFELEDDDIVFELEDNDEEDGTPGEAVTVIVNITLGIGSKPFIRGTGGGLTWEEGFPMDFIEVGKWQWTSAKTEEPVTYQIYKNDAVAANEKAQTAQPGETQEVHPRFGNGQEKKKNS